MKWLFICSILLDWSASISINPVDSLQVENYLEKSAGYLRSNPDSSIYYAKQVGLIGQTEGVYRWQTRACNLIGNVHFLNSNYDSAIVYFTTAHNLALDAGDTLLMSAMLNNLGSVYTYKAAYDTSIHLLLRATSLREATGDEKLSSTLNNLGNAYLRMDDYDRALPYYEKAAQLKELDGQKRSLSTTINNIGIILKKQGKYEEAVENYQKALRIAEEFEDVLMRANAHNNLAILYERNEETFPQADYHYKEAIRLKEQLDNAAGLYNSFANYATLLNKMGKTKEALSLLDKADALNERIGQNLYTSEVLLLKSEVLANLGRYKEAYEVHQQAYATNTSEINEDRNKKIAELETRYENSRKEAEIKQLTLSNSLQQADLARNRNALIAMAVGGGLLIILLVVFFVLRHKRHQAEREAQEFQIEALKKRFFEIQSDKSQLSLSLNQKELNQKLHNDLTEREFEILRLSLENKTNSEIADRLFITVSTVKFHLRNTYAKLGVNNRKEAFEYVVEKA